MVSGGQSSCPVSLVKLDWESVSDRDLSALAATFDCIIATGLFLIVIRVVHSTCSSSSVTFAPPPSSSFLKITDRSFR